MTTPRHDPKSPQNDPEYAKKMAEFERQMRTEQMLMLSLLSRFVKAAERIADVMEKSEAREFRKEYPAGDAKINKDTTALSDASGHA